MEPKYELIISIVNKGYTDEVMDSAKKEGAKGGTIFTGRGTSTKESLKFFGLVVQPEKEIVLVLAEKSLTPKIMAAISEKCGLMSPGQGIAFSIEVDNVMGLTPIPNFTGDKND